MSVEGKIKDIVELFGNYKPSPLIYSTPFFTYTFPRPKAYNYSGKCNFCKFLLVRCNKCVKKADMYDLLDKFKNWLYKSNPADQNKIMMWLDNIANQKCNEFIEYAKGLHKELNEWKALLNNEKIIVDCLKWAKNDKAVYQKSLIVLKQWCTTQENKNDLLEFMIWLNHEHPASWKKFEINLNEWAVALYNHRNLCDIRFLAYEKVRSKKEFDELLFNCKNFPVTYIPFANMINMEEYKESNDSILIIKL